MALLRLLRSTARQLPDPLRIGLRDALRGSAWGRQLTERAFQDAVDVYLLSFPKTGRTWLRLMLGRLLASHYQIDADNDELLDLAALNRRSPAVPLICVSHDGNPHTKRPGELETDKSRYRDKKVILLFRDIRDTLVSLYFECARRSAGSRGVDHELGDIAAFVRSTAGGLETLIAYYNIWAGNSHVPRELLLVRYEDVHADAEHELSRVSRFLGLEGVRDTTLAQAVEFARFDNMRRMEEGGRFDSAKMRPAIARDPESYKTRRGEVGGYARYMDEELSSYVTQRVHSTLSDFYAARR